MRTLVFAPLLLLGACRSTKPAASVPPYQPLPGIHDSVARLDSLFFEAYNSCNLQRIDSMVSVNLEFYHDRNGLLTSKPLLLESLQKFICGKVRRELLPGSLEVSPLGDDAAVEIGYHRFHNLAEQSTSRYSRFVQVWRRENGRWQLSRVISLH